jgi:hypothetical protein
MRWVRSRGGGEEEEEEEGRGLLSGGSRISYSCLCVF